jgi:hypothetical protein
MSRFITRGTQALSRSTAERFSAGSQPVVGQSGMIVPSCPFSVPSSRSNCSNYGRDGGI